MRSNLVLLAVLLAWCAMTAIVVAACEEWRVGRPHNCDNATGCWAEEPEPQPSTSASSSSSVAQPAPKAAPKISTSSSSDASVGASTDATSDAPDAAQGPPGEDGGVD